MNTHKQTPEVRGGESVEELRARVGGLERVLGSSTGKGAAELREKLGIKATGRAAKREAERRSTKPKAGVRSRWVYGPDTDRSFFRDLVRVQLHDRRMNELISQGYRPSGLGIEQGIPIMGDGTVADARARLERELRYVSSTGGGSGFAGYGYVGAEMDTAARTEGKLGDLVTTVSLPPLGMTVRLPVQTGASVEAVTAEGGSVTDTVITTDVQDAPLITLAGQVTVTQQLLDRAGGLTDQQIARDLGADLARVLDRQIITGTGSGELMGLLNLSGVTATTYTDASPTVAEYRAKSWTLARDLQIASGLEPDTLIVHPTRHSWLQSGTDSSSRQFLGIDMPARPVAVGSIPTNKGAGTNEDRLLAWRRDRVILHRSPVKFRAVPETTDSGNLAVRLQAYCYAALVVTRPSAVGYLAGTGCVLPSI